MENAIDEPKRAKLNSTACFVPWPNALEILYGKN